MWLRQWQRLSEKSLFRLRVEKVIDFLFPSSFALRNRKINILQLISNFIFISANSDLLSNSYVKQPSKLNQARLIFFTSSIFASKKTSQTQRKRKFAFIKFSMFSSLVSRLKRIGRNLMKLFKQNWLTSFYLRFYFRDNETVRYDI